MKKLTSDIIERIIAKHIGRDTYYPTTCVYLPPEEYADATIKYARQTIRLHLKHREIKFNRIGNGVKHEYRFDFENDRGDVVWCAGILHLIPTVREGYDGYDIAWYANGGNVSSPKIYPQYLYEYLKQRNEYIPHETLWKVFSKTELPNIMTDIAKYQDGYNYHSVVNLSHLSDITDMIQYDLYFIRGDESNNQLRIKD